MILYPFKISLDPYKMQEETQSIIIPTSYGIDYAREIVSQMKKDITHIKVLGDYYIFSQFKMPRYCSKQIKNLGDGIRVVTIRRTLPKIVAPANPYGIYEGLIL